VKYKGSKTNQLKIRNKDIIDIYFVCIEICTYKLFFNSVLNDLLDLYVIQG